MDRTNNNTSYEKIFSNAINSIEIGIEDYQIINKDERRVLSAVRNINAGILLLFKSKLAELSKDDDEALLKQKLKPTLIDGQIKWEGKGKKTVDYQQIQERLGNLGVNIDWKALKDIQDYRNNIEHYYDTDQLQTGVIRQYIAKSFIVICDFIREYCNKNPQDCFRETTWTVFIQEEKVYESEFKDAQLYFDSLHWSSEKTLGVFRITLCPTCSSALIAPTEKDKDAQSSIFKCRNCSSVWTFDELADVICEKYADMDSDYDDPIDYCPHCDEKYFITKLRLCIKCAEGPFYCERCEEEIPTSELITYAETGLCGYCSHIAEE